MAASTPATLCQALPVSASSVTHLAFPFPSHHPLGNLVDNSTACVVLLTSWREHVNDRFTTTITDLAPRPVVVVVILSGDRHRLSLPCHTPPRLIVIHLTSSPELPPLERLQSRTSVDSRR